MQGGDDDDDDNKKRLHPYLQHVRQSVRFLRVSSSLCDQTLQQTAGKVCDPHQLTATEICPVILVLSQQRLFSCSGICALVFHREKCRSDKLLHETLKVNRKITNVFSTNAIDYNRLEFVSVVFKHTISALMTRCIQMLIQNAGILPISTGDSERLTR